MGNPYTNKNNNHILTKKEIKLLDKAWNLINDFRKTEISRNKYRKTIIEKIKNKYTPDELYTLEIIIEKMYWNLHNKIQKNFDMEQYVEKKTIIDDSNLGRIKNKILTKNKRAKESNVRKSYVYDENSEIVLYKYNYPDDLDLIISAIMINRSIYETIMGNKLNINNLIIEPYNNNIEFVSSFICKNKNEVMVKFNNFIINNYEGAVIRNYNSLYEFGLQKEIRSSTTLKLKPNNDEEYILIDYKQGVKGKDINAVIWILQITEQTYKRDLKYNPNAIYPTNKNDRIFDAVSKNEMGIYENRYKIYKYLQNNPNYFKENLYGKEMTVEFSIISDNGKPQQPKVKGFRNLDLQKKIFIDMNI